jgi:hypothetical protein
MLHLSRPMDSPEVSAAIASVKKHLVASQSVVIALSHTVPSSAAGLASLLDGLRLQARSAPPPPPRRRSASLR